MSKREFYIAPDGYGDTALWEGDRCVDTAQQVSWEVWHAAVSVLVDDEDTVEAVATAIHDQNPPMCDPWERVRDTDYGATRREQARAAIAVLRDRAVSE